MALVVKASSEDKAVVTTEGSKYTTAMASKIGESVFRLPSGPSYEVVRVNQVFQTYRSQKQKVGSPKQLSTEGYACPCRDCT